MRHGVGRGGAESRGGVRAGASGRWQRSGPGVAGLFGPADGQRAGPPEGHAATGTKRGERRKRSAAAIAS